MEFSEIFKNKIKLFAMRRFNINLSEKEVLEWCQNLYYVGKAQHRFLLNKLKQKNTNQ